MRMSSPQMLERGGETGRIPTQERNGISRNWRSRAAGNACQQVGCTAAGTWGQTAMPCLQSGAGAALPEPQGSLLAFLRVCAAPEDTGPAATCCESHSSSCLHVHRPLFHREQKEPVSRLGMFLLLQEVGPALPFTGSPSASPVTCSVSGPPRPTESEHQFLQAVRGFCLQSVIWEMLMECLNFSFGITPLIFLVLTFGFHGACFLSFSLFAANTTVLRGRIERCIPRKIQKSQAVTPSSYAET